MPAHPDRLLRLRLLLVAGLAGLAGLSLCADASAAHPATLHVTVFDYAALPSAELDPILGTVERLLGDVGLKVRWLRCSATLPTQACNTMLEPGGLALRLLLAAPPVSDPSAPLTLGFAVLNEDGAGVMASVYLDRVRRLGRASSVAPGWLTGLVAAHELGHLLLGTAGHGDHGLMQPAWSARDLRRVPATEWRFSPDEGARLRAWVGRVAAGVEQEPAGKPLIRWQSVVKVPRGTESRRDRCSVRPVQGATREYRQYSTPVRNGPT